MPTHQTKYILWLGHNVWFLTVKEFLSTDRKRTLAYRNTTSSQYLAMQSVKLGVVNDGCFFTKNHAIDIWFCIVCWSSTHDWYQEEKMLGWIRCYSFFFGNIKPDICGGSNNREFLSNTTVFLKNHQFIYKSKYFFQVWITTMVHPVFWRRWNHCACN